MRGSMRERRPGVWELRVYAGRDASGKVQHHYATFHGSKRAAERTLARMVAEVDRDGGAAGAPRADEAPTASSSSEVLALLEAASDADLRVATFVRLLAATGMRRGEACALRWEDLDPARSTVRIDEGIVSVGGASLAREPKTSASVRRLVVDDDTLRALDRLRHDQELLATSCGASIGERSFVFSFEPGGERPPNPDWMSHAFAAVRERAGVAKDVHLHSLRHFHATAVDAVISEAQKQTRLGWSTVRMARHYTDGLPEEDRRAAEHVGRLLAGETGPSPTVERTVSASGGPA